MKSNEFINSLASLSVANTFNPYSEVCEKFDIKNADKTRKKILHLLLKKAEYSEVDSLWIGRDLGHRGGRRTGLALTDDVNVKSHTQRWGIEYEPVTIGPPVTERTAAVIWSVLNQIPEKIFLWNVFPLHPFEPHDPFTNRSHNSAERKIGEEILANLISVIKPKRLIAIGNDAASSAMKVGGNIEILKIRHPSYGGQNIFLSQILEIYGVSPPEKQCNLF
ncbi:uracil-DNA glycosylase [Duganella sp. FT109W]|uniref:Uracil-DNA glycosylase n=1 Tax=Duganella margarita TaxID=2692170 RepID=A0ABW9WL21_9BURK|nr:uracil-DNA glycosylase [Duganella margarita]MYN41892.1 uracil-DNA glycosylase [Duganella margarita]